MKREPAHQLAVPRPSRASFLPGLWDPMTPHDWHTADYASGMVTYLGWGAAWSRWWRGLRPSQLLGPRKRRLLAAAVARAHWPMLKEGGRERRWVEIAEAYADGLVSWWELPAVPENGPQVRDGVSNAELGAQRAACFSVDGELSEVFRYSNWAARSPDVEWRADEGLRANHRRHCSLIRDVVGDPFDPAPQGWAARFRGSHRVGGLAAAIYRDRAFHEMPALGDALEDEGCSVPQVLQHCREPGEHVRGCWVLDDLLGLPA